MAKWGRADYLREQLNHLEGGVHVLGNTAHQKDFSYFKDAGDAYERPSVCSVYMRFGDFLDHRGLAETRAVPLIEPEGVAAADTCLYMQATLLSRSPKSGRMMPPGGLGKGMLNDISQINYDLLKQFQQAGKFGEWRVSQLFVGTRATAGARSTLHFDHNDNLFLQISGRKRFKLFAPTEGGNLYAYPVFHSLDRRAQVKLPLRHDAEHLKAYPRLKDAEGVEVVVGPGEMLFLPAYYWHEVLTEPPSEEEDESGDGLTVSINFWFEIDARRPIDVPFNPQIRLEFARQLESLTALILGDGSLVPTFFRALAKQWADAASLRHGSSGWPSLHEERPEGVDAKSWEKLFLYVSFKACLLLHQSKVREFWAELCDPARFDCLRVALEA